MNYSITLKCAIMDNYNTLDSLELKIEVPDVETARSLQARARDLLRSMEVRRVR
jgi:hypothetical protein